MNFAQWFLQIMRGNESEILQVLVTPFQFHPEFIAGIEVFPELFCQLTNHPSRDYQKSSPYGEIEIKIKLRNIDEIGFQVCKNENPDHKDRKKSSQYR